MALALVLGMSQCKKQETPATSNITPTNPGVRITVNVGDQDGKDNNGEKHNIAPQYGLFSFSSGDVLYVGHNGKYVGTLTFANGFFDGTIYPDGTVTDQPLHFYFVGNAAVTGTPEANETTSLSISIANQSANLPVLSYGASNELYTGPNTTYSATLRNQCALVRFDLENQGDYEVTLSGVPTQATVDFANNAITPNTSTTGDITLYGEEGNTMYRWAILLPGTNLSTEQHSDLTITYSGEADLTNLDNNNYINGGISINNPLPLPAAPDAQYAVKKSNGDLSQFTVNANGKKVYFSKANLRFVGYNNNDGSWSFHENQVDASYAYPGYGSGYGTISSGSIAIPSDESTNDRFAWGLYGNHGMYEDDWPAITTNLSKADGNDWGCAFSATSPEGGNWRTLTIDEWNYLFNNTDRGDKRFLKVCLKLSNSNEETPYAVQGILLFPDDYVEPAGLTRTITYNYNTSASNGSGYVLVDAPNGSNKWADAKVYTDPTSNSYKMLATGAVFLPAAGYRISTTYYQYYCHTQAIYLSGSLMTDAYGYYWSSTSGAYNEFSHTSRAFYFDRSRVGEATSYMDRANGMCVRLVWDAN
jgi:hypothetical protein